MKSRDKGHRQDGQQESDKEKQGETEIVTDRRKTTLISSQISTKHIMIAQNITCKEKTLLVTLHLSSEHTDAVSAWSYDSHTLYFSVHLQNVSAYFTTLDLDSSGVSDSGSSGLL